MADDNCVDEAALKRIESLGGPKLLQEVLDIYLRIAPQKVAQAEAAHAAGDMKALAFTVHSLKSSASNLGATTLCAVANDIELLATTDATDAEDATDATERIHAAMTVMVALSEKVLEQLRRVRPEI